MHYTSASFLTGDETLEQAQIQKCKILADYAEITPESRVLDIGCGWGSCLEYLVTDRGVTQADGITLSTAQLEWVHGRGTPGINAMLQDYHTYDPEQKYDALISIEMIDHLCSPEQSRDKGGCFGFQAILRNRVPRNREHLADLAHTADVIFPGGLNPRLEELVAAVNPYWEIVDMRTQRTCYGRTVAEWLRRMRMHEGEIREKWGDGVYDNYDRYLATCVRGFDMHYSSDVQMKLRKID